MILTKIKNLNYLLIFLLILLSFIGAAGLYSAADGSYNPWASRHLIRFYVFLLMAILIIQTFLQGILHIIIMAMVGS